MPTRTTWLAGLVVAVVFAAVVQASCRNGEAPQDAPASTPSPFDADRAWDNLVLQAKMGNRPAGSKRIQKVRDLIVSELEAAGLEPVVQAFENQTPVGPIQFANVYADIPPTVQPEGRSKMIVVVTHFDTKRLPFDFQGANDAAAGTAVLMELARALPKALPERRVTYRLLFVDGEESVRPEWIGDDNRYGSRHHVLAAKRDGSISRMGACVLLDLIGDKDLRLTRETTSHATLLRMFFDAAKEIGLERHVGGPAKGVLDDHHSFRDGGVPAVDLIDFDYGPNNDYWHSPQDTIDNCSKESLAVIAAITLAGLPKVEAWILERN